MSDLIKRLTIADICALKIKYLDGLKRFDEAERGVKGIMDDLLYYSPIIISQRFCYHGKNPDEKYFDQAAWFYLLRLYELDKYMLCTEYEKARKDITNYIFPEFTQENAQGWIDGLKELIYENVKTLVKQVYESLINSTYYTGSGYSSRQKKKRNNSGIDKQFIIHTAEYNMLFHYWSERPTITDDLEKVCYLLDGKKLPQQTIKNKLRSDKVDEAENDYFKIRVCKNGNTHYTLKDETLCRLNRFGSNPGSIGQSVKIKVFES